MSLYYQTLGRVQFRDTDAAGIVHYSAFFNWMEQAEHELLRRLDWSVVRKEDGFHISWPRAKVGCEFSRPMKFQQVFGLQVHLQAIGRSSATFEFQFLHADDVNQVWPDGFQVGYRRAVDLDSLKEELPPETVGRESDQSFRLTDKGWVSEESWFDSKIKPAAVGNITTVCCEIIPGKPPKSTAIPDELRNKLTRFLLEE